MMTDWMHLCCAFDFFAEHIVVCFGFNCRFLPEILIFTSDIEANQMKEHESMPTFFETTLKEEASLIALTSSCELKIGLDLIAW